MGGRASPFAVGAAAAAIPLIATLWPCSCFSLVTLAAFSCSTIDEALADIKAAPLPPDYSVVTVASWMGGDRDGNPFVTASVTEQVVLISRWRGANLYYNEVDKLMWELSTSECTPKLQAEVNLAFAACLPPKSAAC